MTYEWKDVYSVQNMFIDEQHKEILSLLNRLEQTSIKQNEENLPEILDELENHIVTHFRDEEGLMKINKFPNDKLKQHITEHVFFTNEVKKLRANELGMFVSLEAIDLLRDLIITHLLGTDQEYVAYLKD